MTDTDLAARLAQRRRRQAWLNTLMVIGLLAAFAAIGVLLSARSDTAGEVDTLRQQSASNAAAAEDNAAAAEALAEQVRSLGQVPVVEPRQPPKPRRGPGPTQAQIAAAVAAYCAGGRCAAPGPTTEQVAAAVDAYCADGRCRGERGREGDDAEGPSPDEIAAAVADYCAARDDCSGEAGAAGERGEQGERGPPGGTCPDGQTRQPYTWPDGREGSRCVAPPPEPPREQPDEPQPSEPPPDEPPPDDDNGLIPGG